MKYVIGIDAGGTKTYTLAARLDGTITGFGRSKAGSYEIVGLEEAKKNIMESICEALDESGISEGMAEFGAFALAGADFYPEDFDMLDAAMRDLGVAKDLVVKNDSIAGLRAGVSKPFGICIIMGTGFNGAGIDKEGREIRYFSQGYLFGDLGGGGAIARDALFHAMRAYDGRGSDTSLVHATIEHWGADDMEHLARILYNDRNAMKKIFSLCPKVFQEANAGDEVASGIIRRFGEEAGVASNALIRRLGMENDEFDVVLAGSVFKGEGTLMIDTVKSVVQPVAPKAKVLTPKYEPVVGAVMLALEGAGVNIEGEIESNLDKSVPDELRR